MSTLITLILFGSIICEVVSKNEKSFHQNLIATYDDRWKIFKPKSLKYETLSFSDKSTTETLRFSDESTTETYGTFYDHEKVHESLFDHVEKSERFIHSAVQGWFF